jgi:hypothetical protein
MEFLALRLRDILYVDVSDRKETVEGDNFTLRSFINCTLHKILLTSSNQGE